jgi:DNA mismatch repair protein MutL
LSAIRILPENLANQIAAGEVVERPASVVKELLENAVDAGARNVTVQVEGRAVGLIRVSDDGGGMDADDLLLCLERHATSKINDAAGLAAITTLGFRGEALPSIASVARLTITSRAAGADLATRLEVRFGTVRQVVEAGAAVGTSVEVRDLFANVPARRKFLKSPRTELYHVEECVKNCGLAFPAMGVHYQVDGRTVIQWPGAVDDAPGRIRRLLRSSARQEMILVGAGPGRVPSQQNPLAAAVSAVPAVFGLLLAPEDIPATGARLRLFVNGRPVRDRMIAHAVAEGLHHQLLRGRLPAGVLFIRVDPATVDVNVHPTKQEIRFQQPSLIHDAVRAAVRQALAGHEKDKGRAWFGPALPADPAGAGEAAGEPEGGRFTAKLSGRAAVTAPQPPLPAAESHDPAPARLFPQGTRQDVVYQFSSGEPGAAPGGVGEPEPRIGAVPGFPPGPAGATAPGEELPGPDPGVGELAPPRLLGQVLRSYILCAGGDGLLAIDQHAAHERLLYERLRRQYEENGLSRQALLFPAVLELVPAEAAVLESRAAEISRLGLEIEAFGGMSYLVKAVPALLAGHSPAAIVAGVISRFQEEGPDQRSGARLEEVLAGLACQAAIKAGQALEEAEMERLLKEMQAAGIFSRCPHGRPVVRRFSAAEMKKWFNR